MEKKEFNHANSWGERWGDRGNFQTPFELMKYLYTIVAVVDKNPTGELTRRDFLKMVFRAGYGNTIYEESIPEVLKSLNVIKTLDNLDKPIKRYHASLVIARMLRNLGKIA